MTPTQRAAAATLITAATLTLSCASNPDPLQGINRAESFAQSQQSQSNTTTTTQTPLDDPALIINGVVYSLTDLAPRLAELAGAQIVREIALEQTLTETLKDRQITITDADIQQERDRLEQSLRAATGTTSQTQLARVIAQERADRGLGPQRFEALARRSAMLRALIKDDIQLTTQALQLEYELVHGPRVQARVITTTNPTTAQQVKAQLAPSLPFAQLAAQHSTDPSAERGGLIEPISPVDPAYPAALRRALAEVIQQPPDPQAPEADRTRGPIALDNGTWLLLLPDRIITQPNPPTFDQARPDLERSLRERQERLRMTQLAQQLLQQTSIRTEHPSLDWSWRAEQPN